MRNAVVSGVRVLFEGERERAGGGHIRVLFARVNTLVGGTRVGIDTIGARATKLGNERSASFGLYRSFVAKL